MRTSKSKQGRAHRMLQRLNKYFLPTLLFTGISLAAVAQAQPSNDSSIPPSNTWPASETTTPVVAEQKTCNAAIHVPSPQPGSPGNADEAVSSASAADFLSVLLIGALLGIAGQAIRIVAGLKKINDTADREGKSFNEVLEAPKLAVSLLIAFAVGAVAGILMSLDFTTKPFTKDIAVAIMAAGYAGTDFIEAFMNKHLKK